MLLELTEAEESQLNLFKHGVMVSLLQTIQHTQSVPPLEFFAALCCLPDLEFYHSLHVDHKQQLDMLIDMGDIGFVLERQKDQPLSLSLMYNSQAILASMTDEEREEVQSCKELLTMTMIMMAIKAQEAPTADIVKAVARLPDIQPLYELENTEIRDNLIEVLKEHGFARILEAHD